MAISKKIIKYLDDNKYKYEVIEHKTTYTAWDTAQTEKIKPQEVAKVLVMKVESDFVLALIPSNKNLDKKKLLQLVNIGKKKLGEKTAKKIDFAKELWMKKNLPGKVGATPPFCGLLKIPIYFDKILMKNKKIYVGSGEYTMSIRVNLKEYLKKEGLIAGSFSVKKN